MFMIYIKESNIDIKKLYFAAELEGICRFGAVDYEINKAIHEFGNEKEEKLEKIDFFEKLKTFNINEPYINPFNIDQYKSLKKDYDDESKIEEEDVYKDLSYDDMMTTAESIEPEFIYDYFRDILQKFKYTCYSTDLLNPGKKITDPDYINSGLLNLEKNSINQEYRDEEGLTYKNFYNFAKSFSRYEKGSEYLAFPTQWKSLEPNEKEIILNRLNKNRAKEIKERKNAKAK